MKRFAAKLAVSVLMELWLASGDRMSAGQRTDVLFPFRSDEVLVAHAL